MSFILAMSFVAVGFLLWCVSWPCWSLSRSSSTSGRTDLMTCNRNGSVSLWRGLLFACFRGLEWGVECADDDNRDAKDDSGDDCECDLGFDGVKLRDSVALDQASKSESFFLRDSAFSFASLSCLKNVANLCNAFCIFTRSFSFRSFHCVYIATDTFGFSAKRLVGVEFNPQT
jgi:hypothetical protein